MDKSHKNSVDINETFINSMFEHALFKRKFYDLMGKATSLRNESFMVPKNEQTSQLV